MPSASSEVSCRRPARTAGTGLGGEVSPLAEVRSAGQVAAVLARPPWAAPGRRAAATSAGALLAALATGCASPSVDPDQPLADGTYEGVSSEDEDGATGLVTLDVSDGQVVDCEFEVVLPDGTAKDEDYGKDSSGEVANDAYYAKAQAAVAAFDRYAAQLVEVGYPQDVDVISGATWAHEQFVEAASLAMRAAQEAWEADSK